jgi:hypothetical protein
MKYLEDDESQIISPGPYLGGERNKVQITAFRMDADGPIVILKTDKDEIWMSDVLAEDVAKRIMKALKMLPTSK